MILYLNVYSRNNRSDIYFWKAGGIGPLRIEKDYVLGHEGAGVVVQCAPDVDSLHVGMWKASLYSPEFVPRF